MSAPRRPFGSPIRLAGTAIGLAPALAFVIPEPNGHLAVAALAVAILAALHGLGRLAGALAGDDDAPFGLAMTWGLAVYLGLAGVLLAAGTFDHAARTAIQIGGVVVGAGWLSRNAERVGREARAQLGPAAMIAGVVVGAIAVFQILAAAGNWSEAMTDAETSYLGQLRRLADTGALGDPIGMPRMTGLGGGVAVAALADALDPRAAHLVDRGLMFTVVLLLVAAWVRRQRGPVATAVVAAALIMTAIPVVPNDMAPYWTLVVLALGAALSLDRARLHRTAGSAGLVALVAVAAVVVRHPAAVLAAVIIAVLARDARDWPDARGWGRVAAAVAVVVLGAYAIAAVRAYVAGPTAAALAPQAAGGLGVRLALWLPLAGVVALIAGLALPAGTMRATAFATAASIAAAGPLSPSMAAAWHYALPAGLAVIVMLGLTVAARPELEAGDHRPALAAAVLFLTGTLSLVLLARFPTGRPLLTWAARDSLMLYDARSLGGTARGEHSRAAVELAAAQTTVPPGATLGIWVARPDLVRYDTHHVVDLRTPIGRTCLDGLVLSCMSRERTHACQLLAAGLPAAGVAYLLVDRAALPPPASQLVDVLDRKLLRPLTKTQQRVLDPWHLPPKERRELERANRCAAVEPTPIDDPLTRFIADRPTIELPGGYLVVDLRARSADRR